MNIMKVDLFVISFIFKFLQTVCVNLNIIIKNLAFVLTFYNLGKKKKLIEFVKKCFVMQKNVKSVSL